MLLEGMAIFDPESLAMGVSVTGQRVGISDPGSASSGFLAIHEAPTSVEAPISGIAPTDVDSQCLAFNYGSA